VAEEIPIDLVMRVRDEMSAALDRAARSLGGLDDDLSKVSRESDNASSSFNRLETQAEQAGNASSGFSTRIVALGNVLGNLAAQAISSVVSGIGEIATAMINGNAEFERYETQFGVLLGSAQAAKDRLKELADFGAKTPFELPEVVRADKVLQGFGLHSQETAKRFGFSGTQIRTIAGDLAAGTGQNFEDMSRYLGMFASGATGEAISRFQELGITSREELAKMGLEFSKSGELTTPTQEAFTVLLNVAQNRFGGMMEAQSKTFEGMVSNLEDWKGNTLRALGAPIFEVLKDKLAGVLEFLNKPETMGAITSFADGIASTLDTVITWVETNWPKFQFVVNEVFNAVEGYFDSISDSIETVMDFIGGIIDDVLSTIWSLWEDNGTEIMSFVKETWTTISDIIKSVVDIIAALIDKNMPEIQRTIDATMATIKIIFEVAWAAIKIVVGTALDLIKGIVDTTLAVLNGDTEGALNAIKDTFTRIWDNIKTSVSGLVQGMLNAIDEYLTKNGSSLEWWANTLKNRTTALFQEMRDDITLSFNTMVANLKRAMEDALRFYNTIAPFLGLIQMPVGGFGAQSVGVPQGRGAAGGNMTSNNATITMNVYGGDAAAAERGTVNALRRAGFAMTR
jgi:phage-related protein